MSTGKGSGPANLVAGECGGEAVPRDDPIFVEFAAASECISVAGWSSHGIQVLDVGINVRLYLADFVYRATQP